MGQVLKVTYHPKAETGMEIRAGFQKFGAELQNLGQTGDTWVGAGDKKENESKKERKHCISGETW